LDEFGRRLGIQAGETSEDNRFTLETVNCVGACALGPIAIVDGEYHGQVKSSDIEKIVADIKSIKEDGSE
jgi:NADH-quinone oxidoreductase subunit E